MPRPEAILLEKLLNAVDAFALFHYLDAQGLSVSLEERATRSAVGEIPFLETATELYLHDRTQLEEARRQIRLFREGLPGVRGPVWTCAECGESHEPQFGACWHCGSTRH